MPHPVFTDDYIRKMCPENHPFSLKELSMYRDTKTPKYLEKKPGIKYVPMPVRPPVTKSALARRMVPLGNKEQLLSANKAIEKLLKEGGSAEEEKVELEDYGDGSEYTDADDNSDNEYGSVDTGVASSEDAMDAERDAVMEALRKQDIDEDDVRNMSREDVEDVVTEQNLSLSERDLLMEISGNDGPSTNLRSARRELDYPGQSLSPYQNKPFQNLRPRQPVNYA